MLQNQRPFLVFATLHFFREIKKHVTSFNHVYKYLRFQTSDGISRSEQGVLKNPGTDNEALEVKGSYSYKGPDGKDITVNFVANEQGYQPVVSARRK
jgi:hypothetical protein